ncbi:MAG: ribonuclease HII [Clostridium sp.]|jgi:ribonuclease HII|nr:ribonuclease HII [Clostridium sp.]
MATGIRRDGGKVIHEGHVNAEPAAAVYLVGAASIASIAESLRAARVDELPGWIGKFGKDERLGVRKLVRAAQKRLASYEEERRRTQALMKYEKKYAAFSCLCGVDEVGRGPLAGPVMAGAVILPKDCEILYLNDSKQLSAKQREALYEVLLEKAVSWGIGCASPERIDEINILRATYEAMREAISKLSVRPDLLLNDAVTIPGVEIAQVPIIKGDAKSVSIAAASIMAKVTRDRLMAEYGKQYPEYDFAGNKGYGSAGHIAALKKYGPTPIHRKSFIRNFIGASAAATANRLSPWPGFPLDA